MLYLIILFNYHFVWGFGMYTIVASGGKQQIARLNHIIKVDFIDYFVGDIVQLNNILLYVNNSIVNVGTPYVYNCKVYAVVCSHGFEGKVNILKFRRRKHYMKVQGHRQRFTKVKITTISIK